MAKQQVIETYVDENNIRYLFSNAPQSALCQHSGTHEFSVFDCDAEQFVERQYGSYTAMRKRYFDCIEKVQQAEEANK